MKPDDIKNPAHNFIHTNGVSGWKAARRMTKKAISYGTDTLHILRDRASTTVTSEQRSVNAAQMQGRRALINSADGVRGYLRDLEKVYPLTPPLDISIHLDKINGALAKTAPHHTHLIQEIAQQGHNDACGAAALLLAKSGTFPEGTPISTLFTKISPPGPALFRETNRVLDQGQAAINQYTQTLVPESANLLVHTPITDTQADALHLRPPAGSAQERLSAAHHYLTTSSAAHRQLTPSSSSVSALEAQTSPPPPYPR